VEGIEGLDKVADIAVTEAEITMAEQLIGALEADYEPEKYADGYRERVLELIQKKSEGEEIMVAEEAPVAASSHVVDLMAALEASVAAAKKARDRHPSAGDEMKPAAAKKPAKKVAAKKKAS